MYGFELDLAVDAPSSKQQMARNQSQTESFLQRFLLFGEHNGQKVAISLLPQTEKAHSK